MITFLFPARKMDMENLDDLCALRPRGLSENSRDERDSVNLRYAMLWRQTFPPLKKVDVKGEGRMWESLEKVQVNHIDLPG